MEHTTTHLRHHTSGFTIVELLIVIVVIGILSAVTLVTFNGVQDRARFATSKADLASINKGILAFYAEKGYYPFPTSGCTYSWCGWDQGTETFVPGLSPAYLSKLPQLPASNESNDTYLYRSDDGKNYQLMRYRAGGLNATERINNPLIATNDYATLAWGYSTIGWNN